MVSASSPTASFDLTRAFRFVFDDPNWLGKILVGALFTFLSLFFVGSFWVMGYLVRVVRQTLDASRPPLPEWDDLGGIFRDGVRAVVVCVSHLVPLAAAGALLGLALAGAIQLVQRTENLPAPGEVMLLLVLVTGYVLFALVTLGVLLFLPAGFLRFVLEDRLKAAFEGRETWEFLRRNLRPYGLALLAFLGASFLAQLGIFLCGVGLFPAAFWSVCVLGYGLGEVARADRATASA